MSAAVRCDRCGMEYDRDRMRKDGRSIGLLVCPRCWDPRSRQEFPRHRHFDDPQARKHYRSDDPIPEIEEAYVP